MKESTWSGHTEIVTSGVARGAVCTSASQMLARPIEVTIPFTAPVTADSPVTIGGRVNADGATSVELRYADGARHSIPLGLEGFFLYDVPQDRVAALHDSSFTIAALNGDGRTLAEVEIPAIGEEPAGPVVDTAPITVDTISDGSDFTKVLGVRGVVNAEGAATLEFRYPDGTIIDVPIQPDGGYSFDIPSERQSDLLHAPGTLIARDAGQHEIASVPVASVAFWRAHEEAPAP